MSMTYRQAAELYADRAARSRTYVEGTRAVRLDGTATTLRPVGIVLNVETGEMTRTAYAVRYHATDVVTLYRDGRVKIDAGGWMSKTTEERIDSYTPEHIRTQGVDILSRRADAAPRIKLYRYAPAPFHIHGETIATLSPSWSAVTIREGHRNLYGPVKADERAACGTCARVWDPAALPSHGPLCPFCNGAADPVPAP